MLEYIQNGSFSFLTSQYCSRRSQCWYLSAVIQHSPKQKSLGWIFSHQDNQSFMDKSSMDWDTPSIRPLISVRNSIKSTVEKREILKKKKFVKPCHLLCNFFIAFTKFLRKKCEKREILFPSKKFRQINSTCLSKTLLSRNFCKKRVRMNFDPLFPHCVHKWNLHSFEIIKPFSSVNFCK